jgi:hypothetical protein
LLYTIKVGFLPNRLFYKKLQPPRNLFIKLQTYKKNQLIFYVMKKPLLLAAFSLLTLFVSCGPTEIIDLRESTTTPTTPTTPTPPVLPPVTPETPEFTAPTAAQFAALSESALQNCTQGFTLDASNPYISFTSAKGVEVSLYTSCLTKNGNPVTGDIAVEFVEIFDRGAMALTNKPTMGITTGGEQSLLISGGEFYINATQDGIQLQVTCGISLYVPAALTGGLDTDMQAFAGTVAGDGTVVWNPQNMEFWAGSSQGEPGAYNAYLNDFGWFNCDKFANWSGPKTDVEVIVPQGYDYTNSFVFIALTGEPNTLGNLSGEYPVGLECHIIFVSGNGADGWVFAIKSVTITDNASYTFTPEELLPGTEAEVVAAINGLP